jgi:hypothetical protein
MRRRVHAQPNSKPQRWPSAIRIDTGPSLDLSGVVGRRKGPRGGFEPKVRGDREGGWRGILDQDRARRGGAAIGCRSHTASIGSLSGRMLWPRLFELQIKTYVPFPKS